jgi:hypothetical protein
MMGVTSQPWEGDVERAMTVKSSCTCNCRCGVGFVGPAFPARFEGQAALNITKQLILG